MKPQNNNNMWPFNRRKKKEEKKTILNKMADEISRNTRSPRMGVSSDWLVEIKDNEQPQKQ